MSYQAVRLTKEDTPGVFDTTAPVSTLLRISRSNAFPGRMTPLLHHIRDAAGTNRPVHTRYGQYASKGRFGTLIYYGAQSKVILPWACNLTGTIPNLGIGTMTIDHILQMGDPAGTLIYCRYFGATCDSFRLSANNNGEGILMYLDCEFTSMGFDDTITVTDFPTPALSDYPTGDEAIFEQLDGGLKIGVAQAHIKSFDMNIRNINKPQYDAKPWPVRIGWHGRDIDFRTQVLYDSTTMRDDFNAVTAKTCEAVFTDSTNTIKFDFKSSDVLTAVEDDLPLDNEPSQTITVMSRLDIAASTDLTLTITP